MFAHAGMAQTNMELSDKLSGQSFDVLFDEVIRSKEFHARFENTNPHIPLLNKAITPGDRVSEVKFASAYCSTLVQEESNEPRAYIERYLAEAEKLQAFTALALLYECSSYHYYTEANSEFEGKHAKLALKYAKQSGNPYITILALDSLSDYASRKGEQAQATRHLREAEKLSLNTPEKYAISMISSGLATTYRRLGEYEKAINQLKKIKPDAQLASRYEMFAWEYSQAMVYLDWQKPNKAIESMHHALKHIDGDRKKYLEAFVYIGLSRAYLMLHDLDEAKRTLKKAGSVFDGRGYDYHRGFIALLYADLEAQLGNHDKAMAYLDQTSQLIKLDGYPRIHRIYAKQRAKSLEALGDYQNALEYTQSVVTISQGIDGQVHAQKMLLEELELETLSTSLENDQIQQQLAMDSMELAKVKERRKWQHLLVILGLLSMALLIYLLINQRKQSALLREMNLRDALTGVLSRRGIHEHLERVLTRLDTEQKQLSVLMLDVDHFKNVNDTYGHPGGDKLLIAIAQSCKHTIRPTDHIGRLGGEEFMVVCMNADHQQAMSVAERLRQKVEQTSVTYKRSTLMTTVSIGVTTGMPGDTFDSIMKRADKALYEAKRAGRNQVIGHKLQTKEHPPQ